MMSSSLFATLGFAALQLLVDAGTTKVTDYRSRNEWQSAISAASLQVENFDTYETASFYKSTYDFGPFSINGATPRSTAINLIDGGDGEESLNGTPYALLYTNFDDSTRIEIQFDSPINAWGADFRSVNSSEGVNIILFGGTPDERIIRHPNTSFYGIISSRQFSAVELVSRTQLAGARGEIFGLDNMSFRTVPEPSGLLLAIALITPPAVTTVARRLKRLAR